MNTEIRDTIENGRWLIRNIKSDDYDMTADELKAIMDQYEIEIRSNPREALYNIACNAFCLGVVKGSALSLNVTADAVK